jgi:hypothetical protein
LLSLLSPELLLNAKITTIDTDYCKLQINGKYSPNGVTMATFENSLATTGIYDDTSNDHIHTSYREKFLHVWYRIPP